MHGVFPGVASQMCAELKTEAAKDLAKLYVHGFCGRSARTCMDFAARATDEEADARKIIFWNF